MIRAPKKWASNHALWHGHVHCQVMLLVSPLLHLVGGLNKNED